MGVKFTEKLGLHRPGAIQPSPIRPINQEVANLPRVPSDYHDQLREMARLEKEAKGEEEPKAIPRPDPTLGDVMDPRDIDLTALVDNLPFNIRVDQRYRIRYRIKMMENNQYKVVAAMDLPVNSVIIAETPIFYTSANDMEGFDQVIARVLMLPFPENEAFARMRQAQDFSTRLFTHNSRLNIKKMIANKTFKLPKHLHYVDIKDQNSSFKNLILRQYVTNRFKISDDAECIDVREPLYGMYQDASRLNHSADPNCIVDINEAPPFMMFLVTTKDVKRDEELTISYHNDMHCGPIRHGEKAAKCTKLFGYSCFCKVCKVPKSDFPEDDVEEEDDESICAVM
ncbi:putative protein lysine methyltransferase set5 [Pseudogymnoascus destructans]|uniref:SET domain-containing protein n=2 Tax=Pseudogymnoascus destructans TaxID=655981 RepID=L8FRZ2_PSED2|nr:putative protein lysine methyltransferase set5 [Pseudogymnoascus destructans]ELR03339.1 hypothetical protein GMDG_06086 [Pseudogymnoascus destructans 20631-21]OAF54882.1 putative protein lysine methyltransferase set5 [Pseudogymnoascus destructans]